MCRKLQFMLLWCALCYYYFFFFEHALGVLRHHRKHQTISIFCTGNLTLKFQSNNGYNNAEKNREMLSVWNKFRCEVDRVHFVIEILFNCRCCCSYLCCCCCMFVVFIFNYVLILSKLDAANAFVDRCKYRHCAISKLFKLHHHHQNFCYDQTIDMALIACGQLWHCMFVNLDIIDHIQKAMITNGDGIAAADWQQ